MPALLVLTGCGSADGVRVPTPSLSSITPSMATAGSPALSLHVTGSSFVAASTVLWNGSPIQTSYTGPTALTAQVTADQLKAAGSAMVSVSSPAPGGASASLTFTINSAPNPTPTLTAINPQSAFAGSAALTITLTGSNFVNGATVLWNGVALSTTFVSSTSVSAAVTADDLKTAGQAQVSVSNPAPGGGASTSLPFTINPVTVGGLGKVSLHANDLAWDSVRQRIYLSLPSADGSNGNSVQTLDPVTGALGSPVFVGSEPNLLSLSATGKYLYVSLNGATTVLRLTLPELAQDITIPLGNDSFYGPLYAMDLQAAPNADETVVIVRETPGYSPAEEGGVLIYDNGTARPNRLCGWIEFGCINTNGNGIGLYDSVRWNADGTQMFAANTEDTGFDFYTMPIDATGIGKVTDYGGLLQGFFQQIHFDTVTQFVYTDGGGIINPKTGTLVGTFGASGIMVPDSGLGLAFFLGQTRDTFGSSTYTLESFDLKHFTPIATTILQNVVGVPTHLIRWGNNGLAFTTTNYSSSSPDSAGAVYILAGPFVTGSQSSATARPLTHVQRSWALLTSVARLPRPADEVHRLP